MRKDLRTLNTSLFLFLATFFFVSEAKTQNKTMTWTTKSEKARQLAYQGSAHWRNIEFAQAYDYFKQAVDLDPDFTVALVFMAGLSKGEAKKNYEERAVKSAADKTDGEKLFASTAAPGHTEEGNRVIWEKLAKMYPDGKMLGVIYIFTRATPEEQAKVTEDYMKRFPDEGCFHNLMGYYCLQQKKDTIAAKKHFEEYIRLYPNGTNPYDSMGEFYFLTGDMANSEKYYNLALEKYPFNSSSVDKLKEIAALKEKKKENTVKQ